MTIVREIGAVLLVLISFVATTVSVPAAWVRDRIVDRDGFLSLTSPLAHDLDLQKDLANEAMNQVGAGLPIPAGLRSTVQDTILSQVGVVTETEAYGHMWTGTMGDMHDQLTSGATTVTVHADLTPVWDALLAPVQSILPFDLPDVGPTVVTLGTFNAGWFEVLEACAVNARLLTVVGVAAGLGALAISNVRLRTLVLLGIAVVLSALTWIAVLYSNSLWVPESLTGSTVGGPVVQRVLDSAAHDVFVPAVMCALTGLGLIIVAVTGMSIVAARRASARQQVVAPAPTGYPERW
ncbi:hypothetical protein M3D48_08960 [Dermabacter vaginalis]|uniref:hypothetical protein n=1 Tax=Dermabacter vaginalis TaxID=1630135 RepID=UPI0021A3EE41|nr:hypothetical protein [Dermabacter vaginalis]MCT2150736.1 hypothetical protein [Dermabacter vaginalis]